MFWLMWEVQPMHMNFKFNTELTTQKQLCEVSVICLCLFFIMNLSKVYGKKESDDYATLPFTSLPIPFVSVLCTAVTARVDALESCLPHSASVRCTPGPMYLGTLSSCAWFSPRPPSRLTTPQLLLAHRPSLTQALRPVSGIGTH